MFSVVSNSRCEFQLSCAISASQSLPQSLPSIKRVVVAEEEAVGALDLAEEGAAVADCPYDDDDEVEAAVVEAVALAAPAPERA